MSEPVEVTLKPCPFCGGDASPVAFNFGYWSIACQGADCAVDPCADGDTEAEAITAWNTRHEAHKALQETGDEPNM